MKTKVGKAKGKAAKANRVFRTTKAVVWRGSIKSNVLKNFAKFTCLRKTCDFRTSLSVNNKCDSAKGRR